jgi:hypothetical protein
MATPAYRLLASSSDELGKGDPFYVVSKMSAPIMKYYSWSLLLNIKKLFFTILSL